MHGGCLRPWEVRSVWSRDTAVGIGALADRTGKRVAVTDKRHESPPARVRSCLGRAGYHPPALHGEDDLG